MNKTSWLIWILTVAGMGIPFPQTAHGQWHDPKTIHQIDLILLQHTEPGTPDRATYQRITFNQATTLLPARQPTPRATDNKTGGQWSMGAYIEWLELTALATDQTPFIGPPPPPRPNEIQLSHPLLLRELRHPPSDAARILTRLRSSDQYQVLSTAHWFQSIQRSSVSPMLLFDTRRPPFWSQASPMIQHLATAHAQAHPYVYGTIKLSKDPMLRVAVNMRMLEPSHETIGPLRLEYLSPTGYWVDDLVLQRTLELDRWTYLDSAMWGVLLKISERQQSP